jgi:hypothetical protein
LDKTVGMAQSGPYGISGGIILLHLGTVRKERGKQVHTVLGTLIDTLRTMNYSFVPVTEMARQSGVDLSPLRAQVAGVQEPAGRR